MAELYNFFGNIVDYFREHFWDADFGDYQNFDLHIPGVTLGQLVLFTMLACLLAALAGAYQRGYLGALVRELYAREAFDESRACTLAELGLAKKRMLRFELSRPQTVLRKMIRYVGEGEPSYTDERGRVHYRTREVLDYENTRFYLPEGLRERASIRFSGKGSTKGAFFLTVVCAIVGGILIIKFLPPLFALADGILTAWGG